MKIITEIKNRIDEKYENLKEYISTKTQSILNLKPNINLFPIKEIKFKVVGVTFQNNDGTDRQKILKDIIKKGLANNYLIPYNGVTNNEIIEYDYNQGEVAGQNINLQIKFTQDSETGEKFVEIYSKDYNGDKEYLIGYSPKNLIEEILEWISKNLEVKSSAEIIGGKYKRSRYDDEKDKNVIEISEEFNYGVEVTLRFFNK